MEVVGANLPAVINNSGLTQREMIEARLKKRKQDFTLLGVIIIAISSIIVSYISHQPVQPVQASPSYTFVIPKPNNPPIEYTDVKICDWYFNAVHEMSKYGLLSNDDMFKPNDLLTYTQLSEWLVKAFVNCNEESLSDDEYLKTAENLRIITKYLPTNGEISRNKTAEMIKSLLLYFKREIPKTSHDKTVYDGADKKAINEINKKANKQLIELAELGIINGYEGSLQPESYLTRAEFIQILYNIITRFESYRPQ